MTPYSHVDDVLAHHAANTAAVVIPVASAAFRLPEYITMAVGLAGLIWYGILIGEWIAKKRRLWIQMHDSKGRVKVVITGPNHVPDPVPLLSDKDK